jgi:hypothetical protein
MSISMSADEKGYNGWSNYETWCANLWISSDQGSHEYTDERAQECYRQAIQSQIDERDGIDREKATDEAGYELARMLKDEWDDSAELPRTVDGTMYADLLNAALSEVDWDEIAEAYVTECGRAEIERELTEVETVDTDD